MRREFIYRVLDRLATKGLVAEVIESPKKYTAIPLDVAYENLVLCREEENKELKKRIKEACKRFPSINNHGAEENKIMLVPPGKAVEVKVKQELNECQAIDLTIPYRKFLEATQFIEDAVDSLSKKEGKVRIITEKKVQKIPRELSDAFTSNLRLKLRYVDFRYVSHFDLVEMMLFGKKKIMISTSTQREIEKMEWLYTNNLFLVEMGKKYFDTLWFALPQNNGANQGSQPANCLRS